MPSSPGVAVGTVRIWIGLLFGSGLLDAHNSFAAAFWIAFSLHVLAGERWMGKVVTPW